MGEVVRRVEVDESQSNGDDEYVDGHQIKEFFMYLLSAFRAKVAIQNQSTSSPLSSFDFDSFFADFREMRTEPQSSSWMRTSLKYVLEQGLLSSLLPYLRGIFKVRKLQSQLSALEGGLSWDCKDDSSPQFPPQESPQLVPGNKSRIKGSGKCHEDTDITIHVCEEGKSVSKDFSCRQSILTSGMGYFSRVAGRGLTLKDMDISVHCEVGIFDWLLHWINAGKGNRKERIKDINAVNVVGLVVSAEFLQMPSLTSFCLDFLSGNVEEVIENSPNLGCLSDSLLAQLTRLLSNEDLELRVVRFDKTDRITSRLFIQSILSMNQAEPNSRLGHFASTSSLFKCRLCKQLLTNELAGAIPCRGLHFDDFGRQFSQHHKDPNWSLILFIRELKRELSTWRLIYWRLWGIVNYFLCLSCKFYYQARFSGTCKYHPDKEKGHKVGNMDTRCMQRHLGRRNLELLPAKSKYSQGIDSASALVAEDETPTYNRKHTCCSAPIYKYSPMPASDGCRRKNHIPDLRKCAPAGKLVIFDAFRELIVQDIELDIWNTVGRYQERAEKMRTFGIEKSDVAQNGGSCKVGEAASFEEGSSSEPEEEEASAPLLLSQCGFGVTTKAFLRPGVNDLWSWNPELSTRYNQDMQREMEEKYMLNLAKTLTQKISFSSLEYSRRY